MAGQQIDLLYNLVDANGDPLDGITVKFFQSGTTTPVDVYGDSALTQNLGSSITLDERGTKHCFNDGTYALKIVVKYPTGDVEYDGLNYKNYTSGSGALPINGGTMNGNIDMASNDIVNIELMTFNSSGQIVFRTGGAWAADAADMIAMGGAAGFWSVRADGTLDFYDDGVLAVQFTSTGIDMQGNKVSNMGAGTTTGDAVEYDQWNNKNTSQDAEITALSTGYNRRKSVISIATSTSAPPTEVSGDRYILDNSGAPDAGWDGASQNDLVEFNGTTWDATTPSEGWIAYSDGDDKDALFIDDGTPQWQLRPTAVTDHVDLTNIGTNTHAQLDTFVTDAQAEIDAIETGAGLGTDGTYTPDGTADYISAATSLKNADSLLDDQVKLNADGVSTNAGNISTNASSISVIQSTTLTNVDYLGKEHSPASFIQPLSE